MDPMWFYDEMGDQEEWQAFQKDLLPLEKEYLAIRVALRDAEAERKAPWIASDYPWEFILWGVPHG
jgi:hypothetical protein